MLLIIQVGDNPASNTYIRNKIRALEKAGLRCAHWKIPHYCTTQSLVNHINQIKQNRWYCNEEVTSIMVQLPLPIHIDKDAVLRAIPPEMDIDGLNPNSDYTPLTPSAIMRWLKDVKHENLNGKTVLILGRSELVGLPLANLMIGEGATVTVANSKTDERLKNYLYETADIVVTATGTIDPLNFRKLSTNQPKLIVDVGINRDNDGKLCGDVSHESRETLARCCPKVEITPVPGGVGRWTVKELVIRLAEMEGKDIHYED